MQVDKLLSLSLLSWIHSSSINEQVIGGDTSVNPHCSLFWVFRISGFILSFNTSSRTFDNVGVTVIPRQFLAFKFYPFLLNSGESTPNLGESGTSPKANILSSNKVTMGIIMSALWTKCSTLQISADFPLFRALIGLYLFFRKWIFLDVRILTQIHNFSKFHFCQIFVTVIKRGFSDW